MRDPFEALRRYADDLVSEVSLVAAHRAVSRALSSRSSRPRAAVVAIVTTGLLGVSNVALAATADPSVPGDALYGVDRAYERVMDLVGLGGPRVPERLLETSALIEQGRLGEALALVQETLAAILQSDDPEAALDQLEAHVGSSPEAVAVLLEVARSIKGSDATGADVSAIARTLVDQLSQRPDDTPAGTAPGGPPDSTPGGTAPPANPGTGGTQP